MKRSSQKPKSGSFTKFHAFILTLAIAIIVEILSSPVARIWFGLLIIGSILVAVFLHMRTEKDGGL
jgi:hypothetical protein